MSQGGKANIVELFAGIGGFRLGIEKGYQKIGNVGNRELPVGEGNIRQGGDIADNSSGNGRGGRECPLHRVWANEIDKYACQVYRYRFRQSIFALNSKLCQQDIRTVDVNSIPDCEIVTFGWPCQDNSIAGKRKGQSGDTRSGLLFEAMRIIGAKKPDYFIAENVSGLFSVNEGRDFYETLRVFADAGYDCQWQVLNTRWFLPQNRERIYFVGHLRGQPRPEVFPVGESDGGINERTVKAPNVRTLQGGGYSGGHYSGMTLIQVGQIGEKDSMASRVYDTDGIACSIRSQGGGQGAKTGLYAIDNKNAYGKPKIFDNEAPTLNATHYKEMVSVTDGKFIRRLTPIECERLQGFPDDFTKFGIDENGNQTNISDTQRYKMLGNAVSVPVVQCIAERLLL